MNRQKLTAGLIAGLAVFSALAPMTHADPPAGSGWDLNPDVIIGGGSDTTWLVSLRLVRASASLVAHGSTSMLLAPNFYKARTISTSG
jgi:hypothetical protein